MSSFSSLKDLFSFDWEWEMNDNPEFCVQAGGHDNAKGTLQDVSPTGYRARVQHSTKMLEMLGALKSSTQLSVEEILQAQLFEQMHSGIVEGIELCKSHLYPLNSIGIPYKNTSIYLTNYLPN